MIEMISDILLPLKIFFPVYAGVNFWTCILFMFIISGCGFILNRPWVAIILSQIIIIYLLYEKKIKLYPNKFYETLSNKMVLQIAMQFVCVFIFLVIYLEQNKIPPKYRLSSGNNYYYYGSTFLISLMVWLIIDIFVNI